MNQKQFKEQIDKLDHYSLMEKFVNTLYTPSLSDMSVSKERLEYLDTVRILRDTIITRMICSNNLNVQPLVFELKEIVARLFDDYMNGYDPIGDYIQLNKLIGKFGLGVVALDISKRY